MTSLPKVLRVGHHLVNLDNVALINLHYVLEKKKSHYGVCFYFVGAGVDHGRSLLIEDAALASLVRIFFEDRSDIPVIDPPVIDPRETA